MSATSFSIRPFAGALDFGIWACCWALAESSPGDSTGYQWLEFSPYAGIILFFAAATAVRL